MCGIEANETETEDLYLIIYTFLRNSSLRSPLEINFINFVYHFSHSSLRLLLRLCSLPELTKNEPGLSVWCDKFKQAGAEKEVKRNKEQFGSQPELFNAGVGSSPEKNGSGDATDLSGYEVEDEKFDLDEGISSGPDLLEMDEKSRNSDPFPFKKFARKRGKKRKEESDRTRRRFSSMNH